MIKIKKGLNIQLKGKAEKVSVKAEPSKTYAIKPTDFQGVVPKLDAKVDDLVKAGTTLFHDKNNEIVKFTSPVSGKVIAINRGEKRKLLEIVVEADDNIQYESFKQSAPKDLKKEEIIENMLLSGVWPLVKQRPYAVIANPTDTPKAIFISAFDSAPLAPDYDFVLTGEDKSFQTGLDILKKLTDGILHLNVNGEYPTSNIFERAQGVQINKFKGAHPAGNVGVQINKLDPINKGELAWTINVQDVLTIGRLFEKGMYDASKTIVLTGSEVTKPMYYKTINGSNTNVILDGNTESGEQRYISGNVLTGTQINKDGYLGFYDNQITVIPEGKTPEFLGWGMPGIGKYSVSRTFLSWMCKKKEYRLDTNYHGCERAFVMSGEYEKVFPMDILPVHLLKAIIVGDVDKMEELGIYEVAEEDFALCEFVCTSKIEVQSVVRKGLDMIRTEFA